MTAIKDKTLTMESRTICECSGKCIKEAIEIFQQTNEPYRKAKKEVTLCSRNCCKKALSRLFDMVYFGKFDLEEIHTILDDEKKRILGL